MKRFLALASLSVLPLLPFGPGGQDEDAEKQLGPVVGKPTPTIRLNDHNGRAVTIGGKSENWTVLAFFPKAATPG